MYEAIIFDMDGVMVDTEPLHLQGNNIVLGKYGHHETFEMQQQFIGMPGLTEWATLIKMFNLPATVDELIKQKNQVYRKILADNIVALKGLHDLLDNLKKDKYKIALASSSAIEEIDMIVDGLKVRSYFNQLVSGSNIKNGKPHPDIYLMTAKKLGVSPTKCLAIEDALNGLKSAKAASMTCFVVPTNSTRAQDFSTADKILDSLEEVYKFLK